MAKVSNLKSPLTVGMSEIDHLLKELPDSISIAAVRASARKGGKIIQQAAKSNLALSLNNNHNKEMRSKAIYIQRNIIVKTARSKNYAGADVRINHKKQVPVGKKWWNASGYGTLLGEGSYKVSPRRKKSGQSTGDFRGFGNYIQKANRMVGQRARNVFRGGIRQEIPKAFARASRRRAKVRLR